MHWRRAPQSDSAISVCSFYPCSPRVSLLLFAKYTPRTTSTLSNRTDIRFLIFFTSQLDLLFFTSCAKGVRALQRKRKDLNTAVKMVYSTTVQSKFAHKVGEPVPEFNTE